MIAELTTTTRITSAMADTLNTLVDAQHELEAGNHREAMNCMRSAEKDLKKALDRLTEIETAVNAIRDAARDLIDAAR